LINGYKDTNFGLDLLKTIVAFIEELMNNYRFDKALKLIKYIESESNKNIKICYIATRLYVIKKKWDKVKDMEDAYNEIPTKMLLKFKFYEAKLVNFFNNLKIHINESACNWNRKIFIENKCSQLLMQLNKAERLITTGNFQDAINKANEIWEQIKEHKESEVKKYCRSVMAEALQKDENFEAAEKFTEENFRGYNNDIRTIILMMRNALHVSNFTDMRTYGNHVEDIVNNIIRKDAGNFVWSHFRMEIIDMINKTNELKNINQQIDYNIEDESFM
jgi:hypothetical protein